jgi:hypothetical protein
VTGVLEDRSARAETLVAEAGGRREPLERLRGSYQERLRRASDDFEATDGLRVVERALTLLPPADGAWGWQAREHREGGDARREG